jgi:predicted metal-dependent HD superfamily phosphohydrolase
MNDLRTIWNELTSGYTDNAELVDELWAEIEKEYTTNKRHYHNLTHLEYMTDRAIKHNKDLIDPDTVLFSIFYHDIVYNTKRQDNEQKSADTACDRLTKLGVPADKIAKCQNQIIATKDHKDNGNNDTKYLVDFDLAILGDTPENYQAYRKKIRNEYSIYPDLLYKKGRKKVIQHFLDMDRIFKTNEFHDSYEQLARENLRTELQEL